MRISYSSLSMFLECRYKYFLWYFRRLRPTEERSALVFGDAIDQGLNHLLSTRDAKAAIEVFHKAWGTAQNKTIKYSKADFEEHLLTGEDHGTLSSQELSWKSLDIKGSILLKEYNDQVMPHIKEVLAVQLNQDITNVNDDLLVLKTDFICIWEDGRRLLVDNKTSSVKYDQDSVRISPQLATYFELLREEYKLDACAYVVIPKKTNKKKLPIIDIKVIIDQIDPNTIEETFEMYDTVLEQIKEGNFPRNYKSCIGKYGKCQYYDYCHKNSKVGLKE